MIETIRIADNIARNAYKLNTDVNMFGVYYQTIERDKRRIRQRIRDIRTDLYRLEEEMEKK